MKTAEKTKPGVISGSSQAPQEGRLGAQSHLRRIERREWWLWTTAVAITLLLTAGILSFLPEILRSGESESAANLRRAMWGLVGIDLLFDLYSTYQQLQLHRTRSQLFEREDLFQLITATVTDMIPVVDIEGHRLYNTPPH